MWRMKAREKNDAIENHMSLKGKYSNTPRMLYRAPQQKGTNSPAI